MGFKRILVVCLVLLLSVAALAVACAPAAAPPPAASPAAASKAPLKIGTIFTTTGRFAGLGGPHKVALDLIVERVNKAGGIGGRSVEVVFADDEGTPDKAAGIARQMIAQDKVIGLIGVSSIASTHSVAQIAEEQKIPLIAIVPPDSVSKGRKYVFQTPVVPEVESDTVVKYIRQNLKWKKVGLIQDGSEYAQLISDLAEKSIKQAGGEAFVEKFQQTDTDLTAVLLRVKQANPDGIYLIASAPPPPATLVKNRQQLGIQTPIVGSASLGTGTFIKLAGEAGDGLQVVSYLRYSNPSPEEQELHDAIKAKFPEEVANIQHGTAWDAAKLLFQAMQKAGDNPAKIRDALEATKGFRGSSGEYSYSDTDHANRNASFIKIVKIDKGKFSLVSDLK